jgi:hypothetical protein
MSGKYSGPGTVGMQTVSLVKSDGDVAMGWMLMGVQR